MPLVRPSIAAAALLALTSLPLGAQARRAADPRLARLKAEAVRVVDSLAPMAQQVNDMLFSFGELGYQETETQRYLVPLLRRHGFTVREGVAGIPTAWTATWGSGRPVIAIGSDVDAIPQASQKPGVAYRDPLVAGAPGHGEGHNSGQAVNIAAAIAVKQLMERERIAGTIVLWPGVAEELVGAKAYFVRDGLFRDADVALFSHVDNNMRTSWGSTSSNGLVSVEYRFEGQAAHAAGQPWRGRSALDAVELMSVGWNYRREHLRLQQRSHSVIRDGGDQPNVVPSTASAWYYLRETTYPEIVALRAAADSVAQGAAMMTGTRLAGTRVLGSAWPQHFNRPIAEAMTANIRAVGLPRWSEADHRLARALQQELGRPGKGLDTALAPIDTNVPESLKRGGGSDDIGDVSWTLPTVTLRYPSNIPDLPGHHWANAVSMATPIAHKGNVAGAKVMAMTMLDLLLAPSLVESARAYFRVQTRDQKYEPLMRADERPATELNADVMARWREPMRRFYYDPAKPGSYLEQLGIAYPTVRAAPAPAPAASGAGRP